MDNSIWVVALDADCNCHPDLWLSIGAHFLAGCPRWHQGGGCGHGCNYCGSAHTAGYRLQGWWGNSMGCLMSAIHKLMSKLSSFLSAVLLPDSSLCIGTDSHSPPSSHNVENYIRFCCIRPWGICGVVISSTASWWTGSGTCLIDPELTLLWL